MKKVIMLLLILTLLSGCSAVYNIEITDKNIKDELIINNYNKSEWNSGNPSYKTLIDNNYKNFELAIDKDTPGYPEIHSKLKGYIYYNKELINTSDNYGLKFKYNHKFNDYTKTPLLGFYNFATIKEKNNNLIIDSGDTKGCYLFDNYALLTDLTINIKSNFVVDNNNADEVKDNVYTWHITKDNYKNKTIHIEINKNKKIEDILKKEKYENIINIILVIIGVFIIIFAIRTAVKIRKTNN